MLSRKVDGAFNAIFKELKEQDFDGFKGHVKMDVDQFWRFGSSFKPNFTKTRYQHERM